MPECNQEVPKELYDKFDDFLELLFELDKKKDSLYNLINQRVAATLATMGEQKGFELRDDFTAMWAPVRFGKTDDGGYRLLERSIYLRWSHDMPKAIRRAMELLDGFCEELNAAKVPEPEVLIFANNTGRGDLRYTYKISREWINWFRKVLPHYPPEAPLEMAGHRAAQKHFQTNPLDRIERVFSPTAMQQQDGDVDIEFYRVTREKL